mgnify:CR=1 FL=1
MKKLVFLLLFCFLVSCNSSGTKDNSSDYATCIMEDYCKYKKKYKRGEGFILNKWGNCKRQDVFGRGYCSIECAGCRKEQYK